MSEDDHKVLGINLSQIDQLNIESVSVNNQKEPSNSNISQCFNNLGDSESSSIITSLNLEIKEMQKKIDNLEEKVQYMKEEKEILTAEMRDMSGSLIDEAHKCVLAAYNEKDELAVKLKSLELDLNALASQNEDLRKIIENKSNKTPSKNTFWKSKKEQQPKGYKVVPILDNFLKSEFHYKVNQLYFDQFIEWLNGTRQPDSMFFKSIVRDDTFPCLIFANNDLQKISRNFMESWKGIPTIESGSSTNKKMCEFSLVQCELHYYVRFSSDKKYVACAYIRTIFLTIIDLYNYINYVSLGLIKSKPEEIYSEIIRLRALVSLNRLGYNLIRKE